VVRGRVVSFDRIKGYGFVAPDTGGDDVFIHVNDLYSDKSLLAQGSVVEFQLDEGDRGPKASAVTVVQSPAVQAAPPAAAQSGPSAESADTDSEFCDTLSAAEFEHEATEALLRVVPDLTGSQIIEIRKRMLRVAQGHGWIER
jgi:cold shock protein